MGSDLRSGHVRSDQMGSDLRLGSIRSDEKGFKSDHLKVKIREIISALGRTPIFQNLT